MIKTATFNNKQEADEFISFCKLSGSSGLPYENKKVVYIGWLNEALVILRYADIAIKVAR